MDNNEIMISRMEYIELVSRSAQVAIIMRLVTDAGEGRYIDGDTVRLVLGMPNREHKEAE